MRLFRTIYRIIVSIIIPLVALVFILMALSFSCQAMITGGYDAGNFTADVNLDNVDNATISKLMDEILQQKAEGQNPDYTNLLNFLAGEALTTLNAQTDYSVDAGLYLNFSTSFFSMSGFNIAVSNAGTIYIYISSGQPAGALDTEGIATLINMGESVFNEGSLFYLIMVGAAIVGSYFAVMGSHSRWGILLAVACMAASTVLMILYTDYMTGPFYYLAIQYDVTENGGTLMEIFNINLTSLAPLYVIIVLDTLTFVQAILTLTDYKASSLWPFQRKRKGEDDDGFHDYQKKPWTCPKCGAKHNHHPRCPHCGSPKPGTVVPQENQAPAAAYDPYGAMPMFNPYAMMPPQQPMQQPVQQPIQQPAQQQPVQQPPAQNQPTQVQQPPVQPQATPQVQPAPVEQTATQPASPSEAEPTLGQDNSQAQSNLETNDDISANLDNGEK